METILEQQRRYHEERERLVQLMVNEYAEKKATVSKRPAGVSEMAQTQNNDHNIERLWRE